MYSPTTRLLTVLEMLQSTVGVSGPELAKKLEVDVRSVRRYITMLRDMGIPVESETGRFGNYYLRPGFRLPPLMFNHSEILAVMMGLISIRTVLSAESAILKIERVLPDMLRQQARALQQTLTFNLPHSQPLPHQILSMMSLASYFHQQVSFEYMSASDTKTARTVDCYGIIYHHGLWYCVGYCHLRTELRIFRLDRIGQIQLLETYFIPPPNFDTQDYFLTKIANIPYIWFIQVLLKTNLQQVEHISPILCKLDVVDEGILLTMRAEQLDWAARFLISLQCDFVVLTPPELREEIRNLAHHLLAMVSTSDIEDED